MGVEKFRVSGVRTVTSPSSQDIVTYFVWTNFRDIPKDISLDVNPRKPKMNTSVAKQLIHAVTEPVDLNFDINNRGMVLTAKSVKFDTNTSEVIVDFGDDTSRYGVLDGGHTYTAIVENRDTLPDDVDKFVKLEIIVGETLDVSALADARNTSAQVSDIALFELDDKFEFIKDVLIDEPYADNIAYKDNDDKDIQIAELLKLLFAFNIKRFPDDSSAPVSAYSGKAAVFRDYKKEYSEADNIYKNLAPLLPRLVNLYELIEKELPDKYNQFKNEDGKNAKFGGVRGVEGAGQFVTDFKKEPMTYQISVGFILPIFGAFRALLQRTSDNRIDWQFAPEKVWERAGTRLVQNTFDTDTNPQQVGKSKTLWQANYRIVDSVRKDLLLEDLMKKAETNN